MKKLQLTLNKKYLATQRIGLGEASQVYSGYEIASQKQIAVKLQLQDTKDPALERQAKIYRMVKGGVGIPEMYWYGTDKEYRAMVIDSLGPSLEQLLRYCKGTFTLKTTIMIADQIIDRIQWIHSKGFIYNHIDSQNFLVGLGEKQDKIFMIDFGNCKRYLDSQGNHFKLENDSSLKSKLKFKSIHAHIKKKTGRRDDLQSLGFMMVYFLKGCLPWENIENEDQEMKELAIKQKKVEIPLSILCEGLPQQFSKYFDYVRSLEYEEEPDYVWVKRLFKDLFDNSGYKSNKVMDWAERHKY